MTTTEPVTNEPAASDPVTALTPGLPPAQAELDRAISELADGEQRWSKTSLPTREALLEQVTISVAREAERWVQAAARAKGLDLDSPLIGEEWLSGPYAVLTALTTLRSSLAALARGKSPVARARFGRAPGDRVTVPVLPGNRYEALLLHGFTAEAWMPPGVSAADVRARAGLGQITPRDTHGVALVLGAGNITSIAPLDVLHELLAHNRVSLLKLNPTMDELLPVYRAAFAPLIDCGALRIVTGDAAVGGYLVHHAGIRQVHITGSAASHDAVVFGPGADGVRRQKADEPLLTKPITSELGGVSPTIVLPGRWSERDLRYQAEHVATQRLHNGGYNCIASQVVVLSANWPQKAAFLRQLRTALAAAPARAHWYPGSAERMRAAQSAYPAAEAIAGGRLLVVGEASAGEKSMQSTEYFAPVLGVLELPGTGQSFLDRAVDTVNQKFLGTLGANILGTPHTIKRLGAGFEEAVARLRYGTIAINAWTGVGFLTAAAPWGAFPGHTLADVQSGIGTVHNALLLDSPERTVVRGPFRPFPRSVLHGEFALLPKPPWFVSARSGATTARLMTKFAASPSWARLPAILVSAFRA